MDEIQSNHMRGKNAVYIVCDSIYMISGKMQKKSIMIENRSVVSWEGEDGERWEIGITVRYMETLG